VLEINSLILIFFSNQLLENRVNLGTDDVPEYKKCNLIGAIFDKPA